MKTHDVDARIRDALSAAANTVEARDLRAEEPPSGSGSSPARRHASWIPPLLAAAAVAAVAIGTAAVVSTQSASRIHPATSVAPSLLPATPTHLPTQSQSRSPSRSAASSPPGSAAVRTTAKSAPTTVQNTVSSGSALNCYFIDFRCPVPSNYVYLQPLWPFADYAAAQAWQAASASSGAQPWHLDPSQTALLFAQNYLGYGDISAVTSESTDNLGAHVGVGYLTPNGTPHTAAVLHLVRFSPKVSDDTAGWEVVGSDDDPASFTMEQPAYGSTVSSPVTVGGHITGVDENIVLAARDQSGAIVGTAPSLPAGGQNTAWNADVTFGGTGVLTLVAFTGGHLTQHERFAIQGVHT